MGLGRALSVNHKVEDDVEGRLLPRRIRHVNCIQICNFTPFPVRDHVRAALSQPVEPSQLSSLVHLSDDPDWISRRRTRKISTASTKTKSSSWLEEEEDTGLFSPEPRGRKKSHSRRSLNGALGLDNSPSDAPRIPYGSPQSIRRRGRTNSAVSSINAQARGSANLFTQGLSVPVTGSPLSMVLPDITQHGLEKVIESRLIKTFLSLSVLPNQTQDRRKVQPPKASSGRAQRTQAFSIRSRPAGVIDKGSIGAGKPLVSIIKASRSPPLSSPSCQTSRGDIQASLYPSLPCEVPDFFSRIHRPSTNPTFPIDARPGRDLSSETNTSGNQLKVQLWGRTADSSVKVKGKQKQESMQELVIEANSGWRVVEEWEFSLNNLLQLPPYMASNALDLPPNTLLVTLNPPGKAYYLPTSQTLNLRSPSPTLGYSSDPELSPNRFRRDDDGSETSAIPPLEPAVDDVVHRHKSSGGRGVNAPMDTLIRTAAYQQLFELLNLQALILEYESALSDLIQKIDKHLDNNPVFALKRDISERQNRFTTLQNQFKTITEETAARKKELEMRRQRLDQRRQSLVSARILEETNISDYRDLAQAANDARDQMKKLQSKFTSPRFGLLSTLASIYPIELDSPPDLLYTIINVPLPIPLTPTDPAPPLSLSNHQSVNEDAVATALGYVAQLLQLLATYLGKTLVYPVTCVGSRSFIKDGISAMIGPRMFPLFSRSVDTYRFEYGVFLLNKDIEMLMVDRELRALDVRHTLPNLKNLVLTVTHGEFVPTDCKVPAELSPLTMLGPDTLTQEYSTDTGSVTPKVKELNLNVQPLDDGGAPPPSGSTTPTPAAVDEKKPRPFLGLSFSDILRGRYPLAGQAPGKGVPGNSEVESLVNVASASSSNGPNAPEASGDRTENKVIPLPEDFEVPSRRRYEGEGELKEEIDDHKHQGTMARSEATSPPVH